MSFAAAMLRGTTVPCVKGGALSPTSWLRVDFARMAVAVPQPVLDAFLAPLPETCRDVLPGEGEVAEWLGTAFLAAQQAWPQLEVDAAAFADFLSDKVTRLAAPSSFADLRTADLYLAFACLRADPAALAIFDTQLLSHLDTTLAGLNIASAVADDLKGDMRERLFVASTSAPPMMNDYSGRGTMVAWLRSIAVHAALKTKRKETREVDLDAAFELAAPEDNPELGYLKRRYAADFKASLERAFAFLSPRERNLLRQHYLDGLNVDDLGALYRVHRATAARWVASARQAVLREVKRDLVARFSLSDSEVDAMWAAAQSQLKESISRLLGDDE